MEVPKTIEERRQDIVEGEVGQTLLAVNNCIVYSRDRFRPEMEENEVCFDVQRSFDKLSAAEIDDFIATAERVAASQGVNVKRTYKWIGKGGFTDSVSKVAVCIEV